MEEILCERCGVELLYGRDIERGYCTACFTKEVTIDTRNVDERIAHYNEWHDKRLTEDQATRLFLEWVLRTAHNPQSMGFFRGIEGLDRPIVASPGRKKRLYCSTTNIQTIALQLQEFGVITQSVDRRAYIQGPAFDLNFSIPWWEE